MAWSEIGVEDARRLLESADPPRLIDVREPDEFAICRIEGSALIPLSTFGGASPPKAGDKERTLLVICHHGMRSAHAARYLDQLGYRDARSIVGGIDAWAVEVEPGMRRY